MRTLIATLAFSLAVHAPALAQRAGETWTAVIDRGEFSGFAYTWRLKADGVYDEDGSDIRSGAAIQQTLTGTWSEKDGRLVLRQDFAGFVFDGVVAGNHYAGTFYQGLTPLAIFCARRGSKVPEDCGVELIG